MEINPLQELTDEELKEYELCRKNNFSKTTMNNKVVEDYTMWFPTFQKLILYIYNNGKTLYTINNIDHNKTVEEVADILLEQEKQSRKYQNFSMPSSNSAQKKCVSVIWCRKFYETLLFTLSDGGENGKFA